MNAADQLDERLPNGIGAGITGRTTSGPGVDVVVNHTTVKRANGRTDTPAISFEEVKRKVPGQMSATSSVKGDEYVFDNIRVNVEKSTEEEKMPEYYSTNYENIPGGCQFYIKGNSEGWCTLTTPCSHDGSYDNGWLTASHCIDRSTGETQVQADSGLEFGVSRDATNRGEQMSDSSR